MAPSARQQEGTARGRSETPPLRPPRRLIDSRLRREAEVEAQRLHAIMDELLHAAEQGENAVLARMIRLIAAATQEQLAWLVGALNTQYGDVPASAALDAGYPTVERATCLSRREREVLGLLTDGVRSPCIAAHLNIRVATVEVHRRNIMRKLGLHSVVALTKYAVREGLTSLL